MDYCEGGNLFDFLMNNVNYNEKVIAKIILQLLLAIDFCYKNNIYNLYFFYYL